ncbi:hypothetical protein PILCRDRAFT_817968 [Piloderma croceum F 1598]|uniref:Uncharacterized protein n=1 Tax=Piloderma croceum (strain F 1598) TaxID=765440 RepID=A0A0C3FM46_PILCF|nr:hypothetical protein PILCRDRAFT_817968 [Piloderma croceum F 1598]
MNLNGMCHRLIQFRRTTATVILWGQRLLHLFLDYPGQAGSSMTTLLEDQADTFSELDGRNFATFTNLSLKLFPNHSWRTGSLF